MYRDRQKTVILSRYSFRSVLQRRYASCPPARAKTSSTDMPRANRQCLGVAARHTQIYPPQTPGRWLMPVICTLHIAR